VAIYKTAVEVDMVVVVVCVFLKWSASIDKWQKRAPLLSHSAFMHAASMSCMDKLTRYIFIHKVQCLCLPL